MRAKLKNPFKRVFDVLFTNGVQASVDGCLVPLYGVPVFVELGSVRNLRRLQRLTRRATREAERLSGALMELDEIRKTQRHRLAEIAKEKEPTVESAPSPAAD